MIDKCVLFVFIVFLITADFYFLQDSGGICVDENWKNDTVWNVNCIEWMLIKDGEKDVCVLPWRCCPTAHYEKSISY
ncbi:uncharacterized protein Dana_GF27156 [Drosophila ananassae]|uniref:Single domain-containing protein n=1 Tax=Drosophila ananassae TaxID=7217 RepID=A0A0P9C404_DROAN|nr:uncharacterized protein LOC26514565 isoform X1 [Drosophila ananassae]KPU78443.1 uncharacterized protein Dana_GF27156 [Drosophila ananassae]